MFNRLAIKILLRENFRLRADNRALQKKNDELIDRIAFQRNPQRLEVKEAKVNGKPPEFSTEMPADAYSRAMQLAIEESEKKTN